MLNTFKIDQVATFPNGMLFLACEPKSERGSKDQARTKTGQFKWEVHCLVGARNQFGQLAFDTLKIGLATETNTDPCAELPIQSAVELIDFEVGVMAREKDGVMSGVQVWYRCSQVRSTAATGAKAA